LTPQIRRARIGVFGYFGLCGLVVGFWAAGLPQLNERLSLGTARLGTVLLAVSLGAMVTMPLAGRLCDRWSSRRMCMVAGPFMAVSLLGPALAPSYASLIALAAVFGAGIGQLEIAMNVQAVEVERRYGRPIMSAFHGLWSLGGACGGGLMALWLHAGLDAQVLLVLAALAGGVAMVPPGWWLLVTVTTGPESIPEERVRRVGFALVVFLGLVMLSGAVAEGAAMDWGAVHSRQVLSVTPATASLVFAAYSAAMTIVRLLGDPVRARLGGVRTIGLAGGIATTGYALVLLAPWTGLPSTALGWVLIGMGLATVNPVLFSAAGDAQESAGRAVAVVSMFGYTGLLAGPPVIGGLAAATSLPWALTVPAVLALVVAAAGPLAVASVRTNETATSGIALAHSPEPVAPEITPGR
jgi:MFS family permease